MVNKTIVTTCLTIGSALLTTATPILAVAGDRRAKPKEEKETEIQHLKKNWKCYAPAAATCAGSITCMVISKKISAAQIAALAGSTALFKAKYDKLHKIVKEKFPDQMEEIEKKFHEVTEKEKKKVEEEIKSIEFISGSKDDNPNYVLCYEAYLGRWFYSTPEKVQEAEKRLNEMYADAQYASMNDFYYQLGIEESDIGYMMGWTTSQGWCSSIIEFTNEWTDILEVDGQKEAYVISVETPPELGFYEI